MRAMITVIISSERYSVCGEERREDRESWRGRERERKGSMYKPRG